MAAALSSGGFAATAVSLGITITGRVEAGQVHAAAEAGLAQGAPLPAITDEALDGLKFSAALPPEVAAAVLAGRVTDPTTAARTAAAPLRVVVAR